MRPTIRRWVVLLIIIVVAIAVDQITKKWIIAHVSLGETVVDRLADLSEGRERRLKETYLDLREKVRQV